MGVFGLDTRVAEPGDARCIVLAHAGFGERVVRIVDVVTALDEDRAAVALGQLLRNGRLLARGFYRVSRERLGLHDVGGDDRGQGEEPAGERADGVLADESCARSGDHDRVDHDVGGVPMREPLGDDLDDVGGGHHADLHRSRRDVLEDGVDLLGDELGRRLLHGTHPAGVLRGERGDGGFREEMVRRDGLDVRLDARAATRVRAGDGEHRGDGLGVHERLAFMVAAAACGWHYCPHCACRATRGCSVDAQVDNCGTILPK